MAIVLVQTAALGATGSGSTIQTSAFGVQPTVGNYIVAWHWGWAGAHTGSIGATCFTDTGSNSYTNIGAQTIDNSTYSLMGYTKVVTAGASFKITATPVMTGLTTGDRLVVACEFSGILSTSPVDGTPIGAVGTTGAPAPGSLSFSSGDIVTAVLCRNEATYPGFTPTGFNRVAFENDGTNFQVGEAIYAINPTSPTNPSWITSSTSWSCSQAALKAAAAGGVIRPNGLMMMGCGI
jgi:hypothetical protein